jgi:ribose transport system substrate-binding protein
MRNTSMTGPAVVLVALGLLAASCGSKSGTGSDGVTTTPSTVTSVTSSTAKDATSTAPPRIDALLAGTAGKMPTTGPKAQPGKKVWVISCGDFAESCKVGADGLMEAGKTLGWDMTRFDAVLDPAKAGEGIRQAINDKANAIIVGAFDCVLLKGPLQEAKAASVVTYGSGTSDCDDKLLGDGGGSLYTLQDVLAPGLGDDWAAWPTAWSTDKAEYTIWATKGAAKVINLVETDLPSVELLSTAYGAGLKQCAGCSVVAEVKFIPADALSNNLAQSVTEAINSHPEASVIHLPVDALLPFVGPAILESGRSDSLLVIGGEGFPANLDSIRTKGPQDALLAIDFDWQSWATLDDLNRHFAGEKPVYGGWGYTVVDRDHNLAPTGPWKSSVDFRAGYRAIWGK